ncbi:MAG TPA: NosD domain-containing protein, partial [Thermoplasmata archaeon]|nr:NosD domain-containing protein [Thermoplasmata archaeon]
TLTIQAGVAILASPRVWFSVGGTLIVSGTPTNPVVFDSNASNPAPGDWYGLQIGSGAYATLTGLVVRHGAIGLLTAAGSPAGQSGLVQDSEFAFNANVGIMTGTGGGTVPSYLRRVNVHDNRGGISANGSAYILDSTIRGNAGNGIYAASALYLSNSTVVDNGGPGIFVQAPTSAPPYSRSYITCNSIAGNGLGVDIESTDPSTTDANVATVNRNNIVNNTVQARDTTASAWDDGTAGNFWSDYPGTDGNGDGFGDTPYVIDMNSMDHYPFIAPVRGCPGGGGPVNNAPRAAGPVDATLSGNRLRDVTLAWSLSGDDGAGERDVAAYLLYTSTAFDPQGTGYSLLATLPPGTATYTDTGAGVGDSQTHFYRLVAKDAAGQTTASAHQFAKYAQALAAGPHLLSIPVRVSDTRIDAVLQTVVWDRARTYVNPSGQGKNWLVNDKAKPWADLTDVQAGMALWLSVGRASDLVVAGIVPAPVTIHLDVGWNFVGYESFVDRTVADALSGAKVQTVEGFDATNAPFNLRRLADSDVLHAGDGLWVHVSEPFDWTLSD